MKVTYQDLKESTTIKTYIQKADESLLALGYTEHSFAHVTKVAELAAHILAVLEYDEREIELARMAGYLHDIATYSTGISQEHARRGSEMARQILRSMDLFSKEETDKICTAILLHSDKRTVHGALDEVLKDADVMQHCMFDPGYVSKKEKERFEKLCREFGLGSL